MLFPVDENGAPFFRMPVTAVFKAGTADATGVVETPIGRCALWARRNVVHREKKDRLGFGVVSFYFGLRLSAR